MDLLRTVKQSVMGLPQVDQHQSGMETVEKLIDRVQSSTLLEDRRDGCRGLKAMSRKYRVLVGAHGMDTLIQVLDTEHNDHEIINYALETLINITSYEAFPEEDEVDEKGNKDDTYAFKIGEQFTEIFIKRIENIGIIVNLLDEYNFKVKFPSLQLLRNLTKNKPRELQEAVLVIPSGASKLIDQLCDNREVIRNDALLLLTDLTHGSTNLQKIIVFENAFDHIFTILEEEGYIDGGIVAEDCIHFLLSLLMNNPSNQTLFKEGSYIQKLNNFFAKEKVGNEDTKWPAQRVSNMHYLLKLIRTLVSPQNPAQIVTSCQKVMNASGLLKSLCNLLMAYGVPSNILTDTIFAVSEIIRGNFANQEYFLSISAPSTPPRSGIVVLLMSMVNEKQPFLLRCAVLYCFQCYLYKNEKGQSQVVQTLLPQTADVAELTAGQLLCGGLFSSDPISNWFSAIALSHTLIDNKLQKEQLLRVLLATGAGSNAVSLLQQCALLLQTGTNLLTRIGLLQLLCTWLASCPLAVTYFLSLPNMVSHLAAHISAVEHDDLEGLYQGVSAFLLGVCAHFHDGSTSAFSRESLVRLVADRIGSETFHDKIASILKSESYSLAAKSPQILAKHPSSLIFDHEFTKLFKNLENSSLCAVTPHLMNSSAMDDNSINVIKYKDIIRKQDEKISGLTSKLRNVDEDIERLKMEKVEFVNKIKELEDENTVLKFQRSNSAVEVHSHQGEKILEVNHRNEPVGSPVKNNTELINKLYHQITDLTQQRDNYALKLDRLKKDTKPNCALINDHSLELKNVQQQLQDLQLVLYKKDEELEQLRQISKAADIVREEYNTVKKEQEDLLILLTEQENKLTSYRKRLKEIGETVTDDEEDLDALADSDC